MSQLLLFDKLYNSVDYLSGRKFNPSDLTKIIRRQVSTPDVKVRTLRSHTVGPDQIVVSGSYDPNADEENFSSITVYLNYCKDQKKVAVKDVNWRKICVDILECIGHEQVHQRQYRERGFDVNPVFFSSTSRDNSLREEQEYLGSPDEIEAYGYSIALNIFLCCIPNKNVMRTYVEENILFRSYIKAFGPQHQVTKQLMKFIVKYYMQFTGEKNVKRIRKDGGE